MFSLCLNTCLLLIVLLSGLGQCTMATSNPALYEILPKEDVSGIAECKDKTLLSCLKVKVNQDNVGIDSVTIVNSKGQNFIMTKKDGNGQQTGPSQSATYENFEGGYRTMILTWTVKDNAVKQVSAASINLPDNIHLQLVKCGEDCYVLTERSLNNMGLD